MDKGSGIINVQIYSFQNINPELRRWKFKKITEQMKTGRNVTITQGKIKTINQKIRGNAVKSISIPQFH